MYAGCVHAIMSTSGIKGPNSKCQKKISPSDSASQLITPEPTQRDPTHPQMYFVYTFYYRYGMLLI